MKIIGLASDHAGFALKQFVRQYLEAHHIEYKDYGTYSEDSCDYPVYGKAVAHAVADGECEKGIIICGTGIGISITANKVKGIRCALLSDLLSAELTRLHNDTNMMALGAGVVGENLALSIVDIWLTTPFSGEPRHQRRIDKVMALERIA